VRKRINTYRILVKKPGGKRQLGRPRFKWEYNINVDLKDMGWEGVDWLTIWTGDGAVLNKVLKFCGP
jgi:hypothetical protein